MLKGLAKSLASLLFSLLLTAPALGYQSQEPSQKTGADEMKTAMFKIKYLKPCELKGVFRQLMSKADGAIITCDDEQKVLFLYHTQRWLDEIKGIIEKLDIPSGSGIERQVSLNMQIILASTAEERGNSEAEQWREVTKLIPPDLPFKSFYALPAPIPIMVTTGQENVEKAGQITVGMPFMENPITILYKLNISEVLDEVNTKDQSDVILKGLNFIATTSDPPAPPVSFGSPIVRRNPLTLKPGEKLLILPDRANDRQIILIFTLALTVQ